jgi:hypothetical protein
MAEATPHLAATRCHSHNKEYSTSLSQRGTGMALSDPNDIVRLMRAANPAEAHVLEQALRSAGIQCKVVGDYLDAGLGDIPGVQAEIWVHRDDFPAAERILNSAQGAGTDDTEDR